MTTVVQTKSPKAFVSVPEAAVIVGVTEGRIRQLLGFSKGNGGIEGFKINERAWVISRDEVLRIRDTPHNVGRPRGSKDKAE